MFLRYGAIIRLLVVIDAPDPAPTNQNARNLHPCHISMNIMGTDDSLRFNPSRNKGRFIEDYRDGMSGQRKITGHQ